MLHVLGTVGSYVKYVVCTGTVSSTADNAANGRGVNLGDRTRPMSSDSAGADSPLQARINAFSIHFGA